MPVTNMPMAAAVAAGSALVVGWVLSRRQGTSKAPPAANAVEYNRPAVGGPSIYPGVGPSHPTSSASSAAGAGAEAGARDSHPQPQPHAGAQREGAWHPDRPRRGRPHSADILGEQALDDAEGDDRVR
jgi:hypothetical protein